MRPAAAIGTDHVCAMTCRAKDEAVALPMHYLLVAHSQRQPVAIRLLHFKSETAAALPALHSWLHYGELIT